MPSFIALYRGQTVAKAELVAVTADPEIVRRFAAEMLDEEADVDGDPVKTAVRDGRRRALELVRDGADSEGGGS